MWTTDRPRRAYLTPRPLRAAYLVPTDVDHVLLNVLFDEAMSRWGGRRTPIIKTDGASVGDGHWKLLNLWDPDIVYSYIPLEDQLRDQIAFGLCPSVIEEHRFHNGDRDRHSYLPRYAGNVSYLNSTSLLPVFAKSWSMNAQPLPEILDRERGAAVRRDMEDSFGFVSNHLGDFSLLPFARRCCYRPPERERFARRFGEGEEIRYIAATTDLEQEIADNPGLLTLSQLSDMHCPFLDSLASHRPSWEESLSLVVGDSVEDRLLFWNGVHFYPSLQFTSHLQLLRVSPERLEQGLPDWLLKLCSGTRNIRHHRGNAAAYTTVRSCSMSADDVLPIAEQISELQGNMVSVVEHETGTMFDDVRLNEDDIRGIARPNPLSPWRRSTPQQGVDVRYDGQEIDVPYVEPWHLQEAAKTGATTGSWVVDIRIERREDHSPYNNISHAWGFPRRLALHHSLNLSNYGKDTFTIPPLPRPTMVGELAVWEGWGWKRPTLSIPTDLTAVTTALGRWHPESAAHKKSVEETAPQYRTREFEVSDKGRDLLGVLQFFRNLPEALSFLSDSFVTGLFTKLSPGNPSEDPNRIEEVALIIEQGIKDAPPDGLDHNRLGKRILQKAVDWLDAEYRRSSRLNFQAIKDKLAPEFRNNDGYKQLDRCLKHLRRIGVIRQGYGWKCHLCQHQNWVGLEDFQPEYECEVCVTPEDAPISGDANMHFTLNRFVAAAFSSSSSQGPVLWCMSRLAARVSGSFVVVPTLEVSFGDPETKTDIDVLAVVDGRLHMFEVKASFAGINDREIDTMISVARNYRPNVAGFAVPKPLAESNITAEQQDRINCEFVPLGVQFELLTLETGPHVIGDLSLPEEFGRAMDWSVGTRRG